MDHRDHSLLIIDTGLFVEFARHLAPAFKEVKYWTEYVGPFPRSAESEIGEGYEEFDRIKDQVELYRFLYGTDKSKLLIMFTDSYYGGMEEALRKQQFRVWGPGPGEKIELDRYYSHDEIAKVAPDLLPEYAKITGTEALEAYLRENEDVFVKGRYARIRGNFETHRVLNWDLCEPWFDAMSGSLGGSKHTTEFLVEHSIPDAIEISSERFMVNRQFPDEAMFSVEIKGEGAASIVLDTDRFPKQIVSVDKVLIQGSWATGYIAPYTWETRVNEEGHPYPIDCATRFGRPSWGTWLANIENLPDVFWFAAEGVMVTPKHRQSHVVELMVECAKVGVQGCVLEIPKPIRNRVFLSDAYYSNGYDRITAQDISNVGSIVGIGSSFEAAIKDCEKIADQVKGDGIKKDASCFSKAKETFDDLGKYGIKI